MTSVTETLGNLNLPKSRSSGLFLNFLSLFHRCLIPIPPKLFTKPNHSLVSPSTVAFLPLQSEKSLVWQPLGFCFVLVINHSRSEYCPTRRIFAVTPRHSTPMPPTFNTAIMSSYQNPIGSHSGTVLPPIGGIMNPPLHVNRLPSSTLSAILPPPPLNLASTTTSNADDHRRQQQQPLQPSGHNITAPPRGLNPPFPSSNTTSFVGSGSQQQQMMAEAPPVPQTQGKPPPPPLDSMRAYRACINCRSRKSKCDLEINQGRPVSGFSFFYAYFGHESPYVNKVHEMVQVVYPPCLPVCTKLYNQHWLNKDKTFTPSTWRVSVFFPFYVNSIERHFYQT